MDSKKFGLEELTFKMGQLRSLIVKGLAAKAEDINEEYFLFESSKAINSLVECCKMLANGTLNVARTNLLRKDLDIPTLISQIDSLFEVMNSVAKLANDEQVRYHLKVYILKETAKLDEEIATTPLVVVEPAREEVAEKPVKAERQPPKAGRWTELLAKVLGRLATTAENNRIYGAVGKPYLVLEDTVEEILKGLEDYGEIPTTGQIKLLADVAQTLKGLGSTESIDFIWLAETMKNQLTEGLSLKATLDALVKLYTEKHPLKGKECRKEQSSGSKRINLKRLGEKGFDDDAVQEVTNALGGYVISTKPMGFLVGFARKYKQTLTQAAELMMKIDPELKLDFISLDEQMAGLLKQIKRHTANPTSQGEGGRSKV